MLIATVVFAVPVQRVQYEWFTLGGSCGGAGENQTFPESGTFYFLWRSSSVDGANLIVRDPVGAAIYNEDNVTGTGEFAVTAGESFLFQVYCSAPQNVTVTGTLHFVGPML